MSYGVDDDILLDRAMTSSYRLSAIFNANLLPASILRALIAAFHIAAGVHGTVVTFVKSLSFCDRKLDAGLWT